MLLLWVLQTRDNNGLLCKQQRSLSKTSAAMECSSRSTSWQYKGDEDEGKQAEESVNVSSGFLVTCATRGSAFRSRSHHCRQRRGPPNQRSRCATNNR